MPSYTPSLYSSNKGSTLAISLTILTAITLVSVSSLQRSGLQGRMVGSIQHKETGFHAANGELKEIYNFYATQASATQALSSPLNSFTIVNNEPAFKPVSPGHTSSYNTQHSKGYEENGNSKAASPRLTVASEIEHTGVKNTLVEGFSVGTFVEYGFTASAQANEPSFGLTPGETLSSQLIGIKFIAPAG